MWNVIKKVLNIKTWYSECKFIKAFIDRIVILFTLMYCMYMYKFKTCILCEALYIYEAFTLKIHTIKKVEFMYILLFLTRHLYYM